jgi:hypothetical protein
MTQPAPVGVPSPPPGPGVVPPFAAPPTEGRGTRLWLGLGAAGLVAVLCCGGGIAAVVGLLLVGTRAINEQARVVVTEYLDAVSDEQWDKAYNLLCNDLQRQENRAAFQRRVEDEPTIESFRVEQADLLGDSGDVIVPVDVTYTTGNRDTLRFTMAQDGSTGQLEVCSGG